MTHPEAPPGWYPTPEGESLRFWDGSQWTERTVYAATPKRPGRRRFNRWGAVAAIAVAVVLVAVFVAWVGWFFVGLAASTVGMGCDGQVEESVMDELASGVTFEAAPSGWLTGREWRSNGCGDPDDPGYPNVAVEYSATSLPTEEELLGFERGFRAEALAEGWSMQTCTHGEKVLMKQIDGTPATLDLTTLGSGTTVVATAVLDTRSRCARGWQP